jgi:hypothetical protein
MITQYYLTSGNSELLTRALPEFPETTAISETISCTGAACLASTIVCRFCRVDVEDQKCDTRSDLLALQMFRQDFTRMIGDVP